MLVAVIERPQMCKGSNKIEDTFSYVIGKGRCVKREAPLHELISPTLTAVLPSSTYDLQGYAYGHHAEKGHKSTARNALS